MSLNSKKRIKCSPLEIKASEAPSFPNKGSKVFELPWELLMEILSYFERLPIPITTKTNFCPSGSSRYLERTDALRALSQTCKLWRHLFFPLLWERLEPCLTHSKSASWYKFHGESLIRKSSLVCENPEIASHVRSMSVIFSRYSTATVLPACVRAIDALPNLHTLQLIQTHHKMSTVLKSAFDDHTFPQVRTIILSSHAHNILRCCPEVRNVICINQMDSGSLVDAIEKVCRKVEEVEGFFGPGWVMRRLVKAAPNMRSIKFNYPIPSSHLRHFSSLKKLAHIKLFSNHALEEHAILDNEFLACLKVAKDIVRKVQGQKSVTVEYCNPSLLLF